MDGTQLALPDGWTMPEGGGLHLVSDYEYDDRGRLVQSLGPEHVVDLDGTATTVRRAAWTVYQDTVGEVWSAQGYATASLEAKPRRTAFQAVRGGLESRPTGDSRTDSNYTYTLINPVSIAKYDTEGNLLESIRAARASTAGRLSADDSFDQASYVAWTTRQFHPYISGRLISSRLYHDIPESGEGDEGTHYSQTRYGYDWMGRQNAQTAPGGTITRTVFDQSDRAGLRLRRHRRHRRHRSRSPRGREPCATPYSGPYNYPSGSGSATNNMVPVTEYAYASASGCAGCCGGGSGMLAARSSTSIQ